MKIARIYLENFKKFEKLEIEVRNGLTKEIADQFLVLGDNGSGKTTVLQAVALCLSLASRVTKDIENFNWIGWVSGRYGIWGYPIIKLEVHFSPEEIEATQAVAKRCSFFSEQPFISPGKSEIIELELKGARFTNSPQELSQFGGRFYAASLVARGDNEARQFFQNLPGVFWFDQFRNLIHFKESVPEQGTAILGITELRHFLNKWWLGRLEKNATVDYLDELESLYTKIFPDRKFTPPEAMTNTGSPTPSDYYFMLSDGHRTYDIEETSAGEQVILPLLYEFVRQQIKHSVVLIDELDLNLHPPLAQRLLALLPKIGHNCQFIYTTHSEVISQVMSPEEICRLPGGMLCL
jgi:predicted ATPase